MSKKEKKINQDQEFQRHLSQNKLRKISSYLSKKFYEKNELKDTIVFQTPLILAGKLAEEYPEKDLEEWLIKNYDNTLDVCFISKDEGTIYIPKNNRIIRIVDGQHRVYGLKQFYSELDKEN